MSDLMSLAVSALRADQARLEQTSLNAANATTPGYRRATLVAIDFQDLLPASTNMTPAGTARPTPSLLRMPTLVQGRDTTPAAIQPTGRPLDVALEGPAYMVLTQGDQTWLTRLGALQVDTDGYLVGHRGLRVQGQQGDIQLESAQGLSIDAQGDIWRDGQAIARLKLLKPTPEAKLASSDGIALRADTQYLDGTQTDTKVRSGFLEASNAQGAQDMLGLIETVRRFESLVRLVQGYDEILGRTIQKLGDI
jgi:flagellar basal body rod protein FlgG